MDEDFKKVLRECFEKASYITTMGNQKEFKFFHIDEMMDAVEEAFNIYSVVGLVREE